MPRFRRSSEMHRQVNRVDSREKTELVSASISPGVEVLAHQVTFRPGDRAPEHSHSDSAHVVFSLSGHGMVATDTGSHPIGPGDVVIIERGEMHEWSNPGNADWTFIELLLPPPRRTVWSDSSYQPGWHVASET